MKFRLSFLSGLFLLLCHQLFAGPGDTTIVQPFQNVVIVTNPSTGMNVYKNWAVFPDTAVKYQKVLMYLTFECPGNMDCAEWDYLDPITIERPHGAASAPLGWEFARYITPYGGYWTKTSGWKHGWYYDVTDFSPKWHDSVEIAYNHSGYEANTKGWKINISFLCIEGTPSRQVTAITAAWIGHYRYDDSIELKYLTPKSVTLGSQTNNMRLKIIQTGHGMNDSNCSEFCPWNRYIYYDNNLSNSKLLWRECGFNSLYPQAGTWLYNRGNWCPGASVFDDNLDYLNLTPGSTHTWNLDMDAVPAGNFGNQVITSYFIQYKQPAFANNATLERILAPGKEYEWLRINPICGTPVIVIRNNGTSALTSLQIEYGVAGGAKTTYNWTGNLAYLQTDTVKLTSAMSWTGTANRFEVTLKNPNNVTDQNPYDNSGASAYDLPPVLQGNKFIVGFKSNSAASENYYYIRDVATGNILYQKSNFTNNTTYRDTFNLTVGNCYSFEFYDDGPLSANSGGMNCDGLNWWANTAQGSGTLTLYRAGTLFPIKSFNADFGTKIIYNFTVGYPLAISNAAPGENYVNVFPNPSTGVVSIAYRLAADKGVAEVYALTGAKVMEVNLGQSSGTEDIDLSRFSKGFYIVKIRTGNMVVHTEKLVIQ